MPPVSIKRSLEKQVMPVIRVPFPGSNPEPDKRENTAVINVMYADPGEYIQSKCFKVRKGCPLNIKSKLNYLHYSEHSIGFAFYRLDFFVSYEIGKLKQWLHPRRHERHVLNNKK